MAPSKLQHLSLSLLAATTAYAKDNPAVHGPPKGANPLSYGFYATPEVPKPVKLQMTGHFPSWLTGSLYRGAAGSWDSGNFTAEHWFDGFSRNHRFEIANGEVSYRSRNASDEVYDFVRETGKYPDGSFGGDPCKMIFGAFETQFRDESHLHGRPAGDNVGVAFIPNYPTLHKNSTSSGAPFLTLVATTDANSLQQIDPTTMEPIEIFTHGAENPKLTGPTSAAHPAFADDGGYYNYVLDMSTSPPEYRVFGMLPGSHGQAEILATITDAPPAYIHQVFNTQNYIILIVWQADLVRHAKTVVNSIGAWDPARMSYFYVIDRHRGGVVAKYRSTEPFFAFHQINSFEDAAGAIVLDLPTMADHSFLRAANVTAIRQNLGPDRASGHAHNDLAGTFTRWRLPRPRAQDPARFAAADRVFAFPYRMANVELPRINDAYAQRPYRYAYGVHVEKPGYFVDSLIKFDVESQTYRVWAPRVDSVPSEPIFVAAPDAKSEDDGVLLSVVMDSGREKSALVAIDATTMEEMGRANMPLVMGYGFHGVWGADH